MKKKLFFLPLALAFLSVVLSGYHISPAGSHSIDGTGATGTSSTTGTCGAGTGCHNSSASIRGVLSLDSSGIAVTHYVAGGTYYVRIGAVNTATFTTPLPVFGLQVTGVLASGAGTSSASMAGHFATTGLPPSTANNTFGSLEYCENTDTIQSNISYGPFQGYIDSFMWTAPTSGTGTVIFYGTICAANRNGASSGDAYFTAPADTIREWVASVTAPISGSGPICVGTTLSLTDATTGGTWSSSNTSIATVSSSGVVTGVGAGSAVISYAASSGTVTLSITVATSPSPGVISGSSAVCVGTSTTLSESVTGGTWSSSSTSIATVSATGSVTGVAAGTATISYAVAGTCSSVYATYNVNVSAGAPTATITGASTLCSGLNTTLTPSISGGTWTSSAPTIATVNSAGVVTGLTAGVARINYSLSSTCGAGVSTDTMTIYASPSGGTITGVPSPFCTHGAATLTNSMGYGTWSVSNPSLASIDAAGNLSGLGVGTVTVSYTITGSSGCAGIATSTINVIGGPTSTITASGPTSFCYGNVLLAANTGGGLTYQWYNGGSLIAGATTSHYTASTTGAYVVDVSNTVGCTTGSAATDVTVLSVPMILSSGADTFCSGNHIVLSVNTVGGGFTSVYQWKRNTTNIPGATNTSYTATTSGTYTCFENISGGCTGTTPAFTVTVKASPTPTISFDGTTFYTGATYGTYQWKLNGAVIPGATNASLTAISNGTFSVEVSDATTGCTGTASYILGDLSVTNANAAVWNVYPNPASGVVFIANNAGITSGANYMITDVPGRLIATGAIVSSNQSIDISRLAPGSYILKVYSDAGTIRNEIIVKR